MSCNGYVPLSTKTANLDYYYQNIGWQNGASMERLILWS
jgi:hypothetical protein